MPASHRSFIEIDPHSHSACSRPTEIGYFTFVYLIAKPLIWSEAEGDLVTIETSI